MKKYLTIIFFTCFLVAGFLLGSWAGVLKGYGKSSTLDPIPTSSNIPLSNHLDSAKQVNILLIQVDRVDSQSPVLQSLWMIVDSPQTKDWLFIPINPTTGVSDGADTYVSTFRLNSSKQIDPAFSSLLQQNGYGSASEELHYIIFDLAGLSTLSEQVATFEDQRLNSKQAADLRDFNKTHEETGAELQSIPITENQGLITYWRLLCRSFSDPIQSINPEEMMSFIEHNLRTNMTREQIFAAINGYVANPTPVFCSFPIVEQAGP